MRWTAAPHPHLSRWSRSEIGGIPLAELNALELDFLFAIDFDLGMPPADFARIADALLDFSAEQGGPPRRRQPRAARGRSASVSMPPRVWAEEIGANAGAAPPLEGAVCVVPRAGGRQLPPAPYRPPSLTAVRARP
jgi:hypothetical protein